MVRHQKKVGIGRRKHLLFQDSFLSQFQTVKNLFASIIFPVFNFPCLVSAATGSIVRSGPSRPATGSGSQATAVAMKARSGPVVPGFVLPPRQFVVLGS